MSHKDIVSTRAVKKALWLLFSVFVTAAILIRLVCVLYMPARKNMLGYFSADVIFSEKRSVFRERNHKLKEQIMSNDEYPVIFSRQMEATIFITLLIFFSTVAVLIFGEISRLQLRHIHS